MADKHEHVDLVTLEEVHRLLHDVEFASIDDLAGRSGLGDIAGALGSARISATTSSNLEAGSNAPLPRRH